MTEEYYVYSREGTVNAIRDYCEFLKSMYLEEACVVEPPDGGWPVITPETMEPLGKSDEVVALLRELPYIRPYGIHATPGTTWADYERAISGLQAGASVSGILQTSEESPEDVPPEVISLTMGGRDNDHYYLDTREGNIYWLNCPEEIRDDPNSNFEQSSPWWPEDGDFPDDEDLWRCGSSTAVWIVPDFFEILKEEYRALRYVPLSQEDVVETGYPPITEMARQIYREHGWPNMGRYDKANCMQVLLRRVHEEQFPDEPFTPPQTHT